MKKLVQVVCGRVKIYRSRPVYAKFGHGVPHHAGKCFVVGRKDVADVQVQMKNVRLKNREAFLHFALTDYREEGIDSCESYNNKD